MNKLFMSLRVAPNRERFLADEAAYCAGYGLTAGAAGRRCWPGTGRR